MDAGIPNQNLQMKASQIFLEYHAYVRTIAFRTAPNRHLIGDIVNDVFVEFVQNAGKWDFDRELRPLLASITENIARQYWRKYLKNSSGALKRIGLWIQNQLADPSSEEGRTRQEVDAMGSCLDQLPEEGRLLLEAHYFNNVPITELATQTGHNVNTLYSIMSRLRQTLRRCVEKKLKTWGHYED